MLQTAGQRTQAIYLRKHNKRPEGPLKVLWQFLANTTKSKQSIALLTLTLPVTTHGKSISPADLSSLETENTQTSAAGFLNINKKADYCDTYGQVPDLSPFPLNDKVCRPSVSSISLFVVARSSSSSLEPENVKISRVAVWSDRMMTVFTEMLALSQVTSILHHVGSPIPSKCTFLGGKPWFVRDSAIIIMSLSGLVH